MSAAAAPDQPGGYLLPSLWGAEHAVQTPSYWRTVRRDEIVRQFESHVYGITPKTPCIVGVEEVSRVTDLDGLATRVELLVTLAGPSGTKEFALLVYLPSYAAETAPVPLFLGLNFRGNHAVTHDTRVRLSRGESPTTVDRGGDAISWPIRTIIERGYGLATLHNAEIEGDFDGAAAGGTQRIFGDPPVRSVRRNPQAWGSIGVWSWSLSRALDALAHIPAVDTARVVAVGHSRLGKAALWAVAQDKRFAAAVSNQSGCGGAKLFRHAAGETIAMMTEEFPHWFCERFSSFANAEEELPVDQHHLLAAIAPRPVLVCSAADDDNADPRGEQLATIHASPIAELFGSIGTAPAHSVPPGTDIPTALAASFEVPALGARVGKQLSYVIRAGTHGVAEADWLHFLAFADESV